MAPIVSLELNKNMVTASKLLLEWSTASCQLKVNMARTKEILIEIKHHFLQDTSKMRSGENKISGAGRNMAPYRPLRSISALLQKSMAPKRELTAEK